MDPSNNTTTTPSEDARKSRGRSPQANGKMHGRGIDRRRAPAKRYRDIVAGICGELGKDFAVLSVTDRARVHMLAGLIVQAEQQAAAMAAGRPVSSDEQVRVAGAADRLMDSLGLSPQALAARRAAEGRSGPGRAPENPSASSPVHIVMIDLADAGLVDGEPVTEGQEDTTREGPRVIVKIGDSPTSAHEAEADSDATNSDGG